MLQGSEAPAARSVRDHTEGARERHSGPRMGNRIASPGSGSRQAEMDFAATHGSRPEIVDHGGRRPTVTATITPPARDRTPLHRHDAAERQVFDNAARPARPQLSHSTHVHTPPRYVPRPKRRLRGTTARSQMPSHTGAIRYQQPRPRPPSMDTAAGAAISSSPSLSRRLRRGTSRPAAAPRGASHRRRSAARAARARHARARGPGRGPARCRARRSVR